ncbi:MAG: DUF2911 domain-containing protein, partial [Holophagales bacterium]|nr:DUF2911 domain-containing protein [Holophagales bacterium]
ADRKSKNGKTEGTIDGVSVSLEYGRPKVKEREIWGGLVPYDEIWRTGADEATTITFSGNVTVEGQSVDAGTYALFTVPGKESWELVLNSEAKQWGAYRRDASKDVLRVSMTPGAHEHVEEMDFVIDGSQVKLRWEKLAVGFTVAAR